MLYMSDYIYTTNWPLSLLWLISNYSHVLLLRDQLWKSSYPLCSLSSSCFLLLPYLLFPSGCCGARGKLLCFWIASHVEKYSLHPLGLLLVTYFYCLYCPKFFVQIEVPSTIGTLVLKLWNLYPKSNPKINFLNSSLIYLSVIIDLNLLNNVNYNDFWILQTL